jgi:serine/threonine protein kinase
VTDDIPASLRPALEGRYDLVRVLGRGGMATVYLADDRKHHRRVAIKVLRPDLAASIGADRFLKEIGIAARLNHPHILALHDSGEAGGFVYYVMPYIDGGSLRTRLEAGGVQTVTAAVALTGWVAGALTYAHRMGVLHRDIKPENILFSEGHPIVADFGIAKAISTAGGENLTRTGFPLGTPGYMSPEQAAGLTDLDARTDVYSLAVVCYEMLVGKTPGRWPTEDAVRASRFLEAPASHRRTLDTLPDSVEPALVRAMAIRTEQRTASPQALAEELNGGAASRPAPSASVRVREERTSPARRRFSDAEVQEVLKRAAELDATQPTQSGALTIGAIQQAAAEAGIDPALVRSAAAALGSHPMGSTSPAEKLVPFTAQWVAGGPTRISIERVVRGELSEADCAYLIDDVRGVLGIMGIVGTLGKSVSFVAQRSGGGLGRDLQVSITMRSGQTRISIREGLGQLAGATFGGICGGAGGGGMGPIVGISMGALHAPMAILLVVPLWLAAVFATARAVYHRSSTRRVRQLNELGDRLAALATNLIAESALPPGVSPPRMLGG